jgi:hypothetical protein
MEVEVSIQRQNDGLYTQQTHMVGSKNTLKDRIT